MLVGMSKKMYKEMVKEMNIIALRENPSQQQCTIGVCNHSFIPLCTSNLIIISNTSFQLFFGRNEKKMELILHIG